MSISTISNTITRLQKEVADIHHKISLETKKEADCSSRIGQIERSITKNTSISTLKSKSAEIQRKQSEIAKIQIKKAALIKTLSTKEGQLLKTKQDLLKEEEKERKKLADLTKKQQKEQLNYQRQLQSEIKRTATLATSAQEQINLQDSPVRTQTQYDLFISHASEDKEEFVRPLAETLENIGVKVWYDEFTLKVGDSLRQSIDQGLVNSRFGTVILSSAFCSKNWTQYELDSMVAREMHGHKMILPIWHKITKDEVIKFSPSLADKVALNTSMQSIEEIAGQLAEVILNRGNK